MIDAAIQYVSSGFRVFPVGTDKKPLTAHGLKDCTMTQQGVKEHWAKFPEAGIGIVTDGLVVLDFDAGHGGLDSLEKMQAKYGELPTTRTHMTGGGGFHYIYKQNGTPVRNTVTLGGYAGVDIRANGGYIVAPPSKHPSGNVYKVADDSEIATAPAWLIDLIGQQRPLAATTGGSNDAMIPEGQRDATLASLAGTMRRRGMTPEEIEAALMVTNRTRCNPPLSDRDINRIAKSVGKYQPDPVEALVTVQTVHAVQSVPTVQTEQDVQIEQDVQTSSELNEQKIDKTIWHLVDKWLAQHRGEKFDLDTICRHLDVKTRDTRQSVSKKLTYEVSHGRLEKYSDFRPPLYKYIDKTLVLLDWQSSKSAKNLDGLKWPTGTDDTRWGFDGRVYIPQRGLIVIAGVTNTGKSCWLRNLLWQNMDAYRCYYFTSETTEDDFADYASRMPFADPIGEDGKPKFDLILRNKDFRDVIQPDGINIIDWLNLGDAFYQLGTILEGIKEKLTTGIAVVAIQKDPNKELGMGGMWGEHLASLYLALDFERLTVKKAKKWYDVNPNNKCYGFKIVDGGARFAGIDELRKCMVCNGSGRKQGNQCPSCAGTGFVGIG
jgi:hypothetical protein